MPEVIILRGLPGSGKSTLAKGFNNSVVVSADNYFTLNGVYRFEPTKIGQAHNHCMREFLKATQMLVPTIVVDNTNIRLWEMAPYRLIGLALGYTVRIIRVDCAVNLCIKRNIHNVPPATIERMSTSFEAIPNFFGVEETVTVRKHCNICKDSWDQCPDCAAEEYGYAKHSAQ